MVPSKNDDLMLIHRYHDAWLHLEALVCLAGRPNHHDQE
jgi:hypothetical protein